MQSANLRTGCSAKWAQERSQRIRYHQPQTNRVGQGQAPVSGILLVAANLCEASAGEAALLTIDVCC